MTAQAEVAAVVIARDGWRLARWSDGSVDIVAPRPLDKGLPALRLSPMECAELFAGGEEPT